CALSDPTCCTSLSFLVPPARSTLFPYTTLFRSAGAKMVLPSHTDLLRAFDKQYTMGLAESLGIAVPRGAVISHPSECGPALQSIPLPVVLKPVTSTEPFAGGVRNTPNPSYARNLAEFENAHREMSRGRSA